MVTKNEFLRWLDDGDVKKALRSIMLDSVATVDYAVGDRVIVTSGPFDGLDGIVLKLHPPTDGVSLNTGSNGQIYIQSENLRLLTPISE